MNNIKKILLFLVCLLSIQTASAALPIQVEVKIFGKDVIFIFYRDKDQIVDLKADGNTAIANINIPTEFKLLNPTKFNQYASGIRSTSNKQRIVFEVNEELKFQGIINGEKLDAIKFRSGKKKETDDLSQLSAAKNDPGAIKYNQVNGKHTLSFNLGSDDSAVATFFRGKYIWIVFDQKKVFSFKEGGVFSNFKLIPSEEGTVLRMQVDPTINHASAERVPAGWNIDISAHEDKNYKLENIIIPQPLPGLDGFLINGDFEKSKIISFIDPELGDVINAVPVTTSGSRVVSGLDSIEFSLLNSIQGIALVLYSDDVLVEKHDDAIKVVSNTALPEDLSVQTDLFPLSIDKYLKLPTILPYLDKKLDILNFNQQKSRLISEASLAKDNRSSFDRNFDLARFFFIHGWYQESLDALKVAKKYSYTDYQENLQARFLTAVNYSLIGEHSAGKEEYDDLLSYKDVKRIAEVNIWNNYNEFALGSNPGVIGISDALKKTMTLYSDDKYWQLVFSEIELAIIAYDLKFVEKIFREVRVPKAGQYANSLKYYKAEYYKKKKQNNLAKQYYRDLTVQYQDVRNQVRAEFALAKLRHKENEITVQEAIEALEGLRYSWRGDQLEYDILMQLATYYRDSKDIMNALRTYQYIQSAFNNKVSNFYITSKMAKIFNDVFLPGGLGEEMDDFTVVALFYEFKELNPIGELGDDIIIAIAKRLVRLDLLENAADLLRHQINYRLKGAKRVVNADHLAIVLMMDKKPSEAILILDDSDKDNFNFEEHEYRVRLRAKALINLEKYDEALDYIRDDKSDEAEILRKEALFQSKRWNNYADIIGLNFEETIKKVSTDKAAAQDILRLAISYYMLNIQDQLVLISQEVGDSNVALRNTVDLLISSSGSIDYKNLDKSLDIDQMKILLDKYKNQFLDSAGK
jgi:hypothetical protein